MTEISNIISNVGFPIVACVIMFNQQNKLNDAIVKLSITLDNIDSRVAEIEKRRKVC